jgi:hypothetical protein
MNEEEKAQMQLEYENQENCFANAQNEDFMSELDEQGYKYLPEDEMPEDFENWLNITWVSIYAVRCKCTKSIEVHDCEIEKMYANTTAYCRWCGRDNWHDGILKYNVIHNNRELQDWLDEGYEEPKDDGCAILEAMGYELPPHEKGENE